MPIPKFILRFAMLDVEMIFQTILRQDGLQEWIMDLVRHDQLFLKGENGLGVSLADIGGGYSAITIEISQKQNGNKFRYRGSTRSKRVGGSPILLDSGKAYDSFFMKVDQDFFSINMDPVRGETNLYHEWGEEITDLQKENLNKVIDELRKATFQEIQRIRTAA